MALKYKNLNFRKLKISDYSKFSKLFYSCFKKKISFEFFKWRYFNDNFSFCYGAFDSSRLIANVGMISHNLSKKPNHIIYSRHSSMVLKKYRGIGIFSNLLEIVKKKISKKTPIIFMWPNKNNFSNFGISTKNIIKNKFYIYKTKKSLILSDKTKSYSISSLIRYRNYIEENSSPFKKNFVYFKKRYLSYRKNEYFLNKFVFKHLTSVFILKKNKDKSGLNNVVLDHFGSKKIYSQHLLYLIANQKKLIFLSKKLINNSNYELINTLYLKIGFIKKSYIKQKKNFLKNKEIFLGDSDIFMTIK